ncbi:hypothetical protein TorRG33x02_267220, partial [Trema orientale]
GNRLAKAPAACELAISPIKLSPRVFCLSRHEGREPEACLRNVSATAFDESPPSNNRNLSPVVQVD